MEPERWRQIKDVFDAALDRDPDSRAEFIRQECDGDDGLREEVASLLDSDACTASRLEPPAIERLPNSVRPADRAQLEAGKKIGNYIVTGEIDRGGMGVVWRARHVNLRAREAAIKCITASPEFGGSKAAMVARFRREAHIQSQLDHSGIVRIYEFHVEAGQCYLVMELVQGSSLRAILESSGSLPAEQASSLIIQTLEALSYAHNLSYVDEDGNPCIGLTHRDIKPGNLLVDAHGTIKLTDFGIAKITGDAHQTRTGFNPGTLEYMSPEQILGKEVDARSDLYSLGVTFYEILAGRVPFRRDEYSSDYALLQAHLEVEPHGLSAIDESLPPAISAVVARALHKAPESRFQTALEFRDAILEAHSWSSGSPTSLLTLAIPGGSRRLAADSGPFESQTGTRLAHVVSVEMAVVGGLDAAEQTRMVGRLQELCSMNPDLQQVRGTYHFVSKRTDDGFAVAFLTRPEAAVNFAVSLTRAVRRESLRPLRIGIASGPTHIAGDPDGRRGFSGDGADDAERVMRFGDEGHILLSESAVLPLRNTSEWQPKIRKIRIRGDRPATIWALTDADVGNPALPASARREISKRMLLAAGLVPLVLATAFASYWYTRGHYIRPSIAVLPFKDLSPDHDQEYFSDGLTEELIDGLTKIPEIHVAGSTSSSRFRGLPADPRAIGNQLGVAAFLEGSIRPQGNQVRIAVRLIKTADGFPLWSETFDSAIGDMVDVQEEIGRRVAASLKVNLLGRKTASQRTNADAYRAFQEGAYFLAHGKVTNGMKYLEEAIRHDARYAPAWTMLAEAYSTEAGGGLIPAEEGYRKARQAVQTALQIDPNLAAAHAVLAIIETFRDWDWAAAERSIRRAQELEPGDSGINSTAASLARVLGHFDQAITLYKRTLEIDPLHTNAYKNFGLTLYYAGRYEEAANSINKAYEQIPTMWDGHLYLTEIRLMQRRFDDALAEAEKEKHPAFRVTALALANQARGNKSASDTNLRQMLDQFGKEAPCQIAAIYAARGESGDALAWLGRSLEAHDDSLPEIMNDPILNPLRSDPRFADLSRRIGLPQPPKSSR